MLPEISYPQNIKSGDFIEIISKATWEIKEPRGNTKGTTMLNQFKSQKDKAHKFIIDIHLSNMDSATAINEIENILLDKRYNWIEEVILMNKLKVIKIWKKIK